MDWTKVGTVQHYFDRIGVAAIALYDNLALGDWIAFVRGEELLFEQEVTSMQIEHESIDFATAGEDVGLKVEGRVTEGIEIYKRLSD